MNTQAFGKCTWETMFFMAAGYDLNQEPESVKKPLYYTFFKSIGDVLPCVYCRRSYKVFFEELDMHKYFNAKCGLMKFVYDLKNKVNQKLLHQEFEAAIERYHQLKAYDANLTKDQLGEELRNLAKVFYTKDAPPFEQVVQDFEKHKAGCSAKMKTCRKADASLLSAPAPNTPSSLFSSKPATDTMHYATILTGGSSKPMVRRASRSKNTRKSKTKTSGGRVRRRSESRSKRRRKQ